MAAGPMFVYDLARAYAALGLIVAAAFLWRGLERVAPGAVGAYAFRPLILPGLVLLWPIVIWRWRVLASGPAALARGRHYRGTQRLAAAVLALLPLLLLALLALRQPGAPSSMRLEPSQVSTP